MTQSNVCNFELVTFIYIKVFAFSHPAASHVQESIVVPIIPPRDAAVDLHLQIFVGFKSR